VRVTDFNAARIYGQMWNIVLLFSMPLGVVTVTQPLVAPVGTLTVIPVADTTLKVAETPLKVTLVAPVRSVPRILTCAPTLPAEGSVLTKGPRPTDWLKAVPSLYAPSRLVTP
jgi:hypothetical protein